jgi:hypothetical protein
MVAHLARDSFIFAASAGAISQMNTLFSAGDADEHAQRACQAMQTHLRNLLPLLLSKITELRLASSIPSVSPSVIRVFSMLSSIPTMRCPSKDYSPFSSQRPLIFPSG